MSYKDWKNIAFEKDSVKVSGHYYTSVRSVHYNENEKAVRITHQSDRCSDEEFLEYLYQELPELKALTVERVYDDQLEWLCDWNVGKPKGGPFMITVFFFKEDK